MDDKKLQEESEEYAKYLNVNLDKKFAPILEKIDEMVIRLEEYESSITMIHNTSKDVVGAPNEEAPLTKLTEDCSNGLSLLCHQIDTVENSIAVIRAEVNKMETAVLNAEMDLGAKKPNKIVSFLREYRLA